MIYLVDYPQTKAEAFALARHSYALNGVFEVNEVPKVDAEEADEDDEEGEGGSDEDDEDDEEQSQKSKQAAKVEGAAEEQKLEMTPDSQETQKTMQTIIEQFMIARSLSAANSALRQMAFMKVNFRDEGKTTEQKDAEGNVVQKVRNSEDVFLQELYSLNIDKYAQFYVQYLKFKDLVTVEPLMPDKEALSSIKNLEKAGELYLSQLEEQDAQVEEEMNTIREEAKERDDQAETDKAIEELKERQETFR